MDKTIKGLEQKGFPLNKGVDKLRAKRKQTATMLACIVLAISAFTIIGSAINNHFLQGWGSFPVMSIITAVSFALTTIIILGEINSINHPKYAIVSGVFILCVALLNIFQFFGITQIQWSLFDPANINIITSGCQLLVGLWLINFGTVKYKYAFIIPLLIGLVSFSKVQGVLSGNSFLYVAPVPVNTAVCLFCLSFIFVIEQKNMFYEVLTSRMTGGKVIRIFFVLLFIIIFGTDFLFHKIADLYNPSVQDLIMYMMAFIFVIAFFAIVFVAIEINAGDKIKLKLETRNAAHAKMLQSIALPLVNVDLNAIITHWNKAAEKLFDISEREAKGNVLSDLLAVKYVTGGREEAIEALHQHGEWYGQIEARKKDNTILHLLLSSSAIKNEEGFITELMMIFKDISDIKEYETKISELNEELKVSNEMLQSQVYDLETFTGNASHDLRSPLSNIITLSDILAIELEGNLTDDAKNYLDLIKGRALFMNQLIQDLLNFSKLGAKLIKFDKVDLNMLLKIVIDDLLSSSENQHKKIDFNIENLPLINGDAPILRQLFTNLLSNSIKYTKAGQDIRISISSKEEDNYIIVSIKDNGIGIDKKYHSQLFTPFKRFSSSDYEGTGLGLTIVKRVVEKHLGKIWLESDVDKGTTFHFSLLKYNK